MFLPCHYHDKVELLKTLVAAIHPDENLKQAQRLFHGRGHAYPGLSHITIDWLPPVILVTLFAKEDEALVKLLAESLAPRFPGCKSVQVQHRYIKEGPVKVLRGEKIQHFSIWENDLAFQISLGTNKNTGLFLDMREGRQWVMQHGADKKVLNLFAYTCAFSVAAVAGNAAAVLNVDMSSQALSIGRQNHRLNQQDLNKVRFEKLDIFKSFGRLKKRGPFDLLVCDPPTFQKGSVDIQRDYPKIIRRLDEFMAEKCQLMLCLNAPELGRDFLLGHMSRLAPDFTLIDEISAPAVFKEAEGKGLTVLCFERE